MRFPLAAWLVGYLWSHAKPLKILRQKHRLRDFPTDAAGRLPAADIDLRGGCGCARCLGLSYVSARELSVHARAGRSMTNHLRPTAAMIDLEGIETYDAFVKAVSYQSGGNDTRMVKKARRLGYTVRRIAPNSYARSIALVRESRHVRSQGIVVYAMLNMSSRVADTRQPYTSPPCDLCWMIDWGVFGPSEDGERLVAFGQTRRSGNYLDLEHLMGHGDHLKDGVVKLLLFEIMAWLKEETDPKVVGIRYVQYGAVENGSAVTTQWRRYMQFRPYLVNIVARDPSPIPADFRGLRYLYLNPDVARAGMDPHTHYALFGMNMSRPYRAGDDRHAPS